MHKRLLLLLLLLLLPLTAVGAAPPPQARLKSLKEALSQEKTQQRRLKATAQTLTTDIDHTTHHLVTLEKTIRSQHQSLRVLRAQLQKLRQKKAREEQKHQAHTLRLEKTLEALQRFSLHYHTPPLLLAGPPLSIIRGLILLRDVVPLLKARITVIRASLSSLRAHNLRITRKVDQIQSAFLHLHLQKRNLRVLLSAKARLQEETRHKQAKNAQAIKDILQKSKTLQDLLEHLRKAQEKAQKSKKKFLSLRDLPLFPMRGNLVPPVEGVVVRRYGDNIGFTRRAEGVSVRTESEEAVVAPFDGKVLFAGPFRQHGFILILAHRRGYYSVLSGLHTLSVSLGQSVVRGEPVGLMPKTKAPLFYFELRRHDHPIDPARWVRFASRRVS